MSIRYGFLIILFAMGIAGSLDAQSGQTVVVRGGISSTGLATSSSQIPASLFERENFLTSVPG